MTTVVFRNGIIASDSLAVLNGSTRMPGDFQKIWRLKDGSLIGASGEYHSATNAIMGAVSANEIKTLSEYSGTEILCVRPDRTIRTQNKGVWAEVGTPEFYAIGSGATAALGALHQGATAEDAIRAASLVDIFTNDKIRTLSFGGIEQMPSIPADKKSELSPGLWKRLFARR